MENRGLGGIALLLVVGIAVVFFGVFGGPGALFSDGSADTPARSGDFYAYDEAGVLTQETKDYIVAKNNSLCGQCGSQIVVACVKTTGNTTIGEYAQAMFKSWEIGDAATNNGVLLMLAIDDNDYYMLQGDGIKTSFPTGEIRVILADDMEPDFAVGDYNAAVTKTFDRIVAHFEAAYGIEVVEAPGRTVTEVSDSDIGGGGSGTGLSVSRKDIVDFGVFVVKSVMVMLTIVIVGMVIIVVATILLIVFLMRRKKKKGESFSIDDMVEPKAPPKKNVNPYSAGNAGNAGNESERSVKENEE